MASKPIPRPEEILSPPLSSKTDPAMREVQAVCTKHSVPCGSPNSLAQFMHALQADKHLAMDFWSLIARLSDQHRTTDPDWMLGVVAKGVTGQSAADIRTAGPSQRVLLEKLAGMLAGQDIAPEPQPQPIQPAPFAPELEDIVPPPDDAPRNYIQHRKSSSRTGRRRLVLNPDTPIAAAMDRNLQDRDSRRPQPDPEPEITIPLAAYAEEDSRSFASPRLILALLFIVFVAGCLVAVRCGNPAMWQRLDAATRAKYGYAVAALQHRDAAPPASAANLPANSSTNSTLSPPSDSTDSQPATAAANPPTFEPAAPANPPPSSQPAAQTPEPATPQRAEPPAEPPATDSARQQPETQPHDEASVAVPASEMRNHLIASRIPIYPAGAHGTVVIEAVVTTRGTVEPVRVVSGEPDLRQAAMDAVATWHYRPYMLNGYPVDVSTTISVNDTGND